MFWIWPSSNKLILQASFWQSQRNYRERCCCQHFKTKCKAWNISTKVMTLGSNWVAIEAKFQKIFKFLGFMCYFSARSQQSSKNHLKIIKIWLKSSAWNLKTCIPLKVLVIFRPLSWPLRRNTTKTKWIWVQITRFAVPFHNTLSPSRGSRGFTLFCLSSFFTNAKLHSFTDQTLFKYFSENFINFCGVVVITSASQLQGSRFDSGWTQYIIYILLRQDSNLCQNEWFRQT